MDIGKQRRPKIAPEAPQSIPKDNTRWPKGILCSSSRLDNSSGIRTQLQPSEFDIDYASRVFCMSFGTWDGVVLP
eukprot:4651058-Pyramimonas_sp.AAC.1